MFIIFSVFYILIAAAMVVLILMQRGQGADAGAGFGGGSSATMFGSSGSGNFLSRMTGALATLFFLLSLGMAIYLAHTGNPNPTNDLGVMSGVASTQTQSTASEINKGSSSVTQNQAVPSAIPDEGQTEADKGAAAGDEDQNNDLSVPKAASGAGKDNTDVPDLNKGTASGNK